MTCSATQQGDEMACGRCALRWDVADPNRPPCLQHERRTAPRVLGLPPVPMRPLVGMERRQEVEARRRQEEPAGRVDYRDLLLKYMRHMVGKEGSTGAAWIGSDGRGYFSGVLFSPEEVATLKACAAELDGG